MDPDGTCFIILCIAVGVVLFGGLGAAFGTANYATTTPRDDWRADDAAGAAAGAFVEAGSYAIPGAGAGVLAKALTKVPKAARVVVQTGRRAASTVRGIKVRGGEIVLSRNFRIGPLPSLRETTWPKRLPHYHRRGPIDPMTGGAIKGQGIGRHQPWQTSPTDRTFWDRF